MLPVFIMAIEDDSDRQFAAELYHSYHSIMHQKALSILKKEDLAEDAVQDAMLKIICHLDKIREIPKREIPFYLIAITQTTCIDRYRKIQREKQACVMGYEDDGAKDFSDPKTPEKVFIHTDQIKLLNCCLKELPQREIDLLYVLFLHYGAFRKGNCQVNGNDRKCNSDGSDTGQEKSFVCLSKKGRR